MNISDKVVSFFSPEAALKRMQYRKMLEIKSRAYDGASRSKRTSKWCANPTSANAEVYSAQRTLRDRARDLIRNDPYANRGQALIASNIVGKGILPQLPDGDISQAWKLWAETTMCDFNETQQFSGIQELVVKSMVSDGEIFVKKIIDKSAKIPLKLQVLESDFVPMDFGIAKTVQGIELNEAGQIVAYHMFKNHPNNNGQDRILKHMGETIRVPAKDIAHIFRQDRAGQLRGVSWLAPIMIMLRDLNEYQGAELMKQKVSSLFAGFIKDLDGDLEGESSDLTLEPATLQQLPSGMDITFSNPPSTEFYEPYTKTVLHSIATGMGVTYEGLTGDLSQVNFSSARMGWLEMSRNFDVWRKHTVNTQFNAKVFGWFLEACKLSGLNVPSMDFIPSWTSPRREMIDPTKEVPAKIKAIRAGLCTLSDAIRETGKHPDDHFKDLADDNKLIDSYGLILDSDARIKAQNGQNLVEGNTEDETNKDQ